MLMYAVCRLEIFHMAAVLGRTRGSYLVASFAAWPGVTSQEATFLVRGHGRGRGEKPTSAKPWLIFFNAYHFLPCGVNLGLDESHASAIFS